MKDETISSFTSLYSLMLSTKTPTEKLPAQDENLDLNSKKKKKNNSQKIIFNHNKHFIKSINR